jgi:hypothetical protein
MGHAVVLPLLPGIAPRGGAGVKGAVIASKEVFFF